MAPTSRAFRFSRVAAILLLPLSASCGFILSHGPPAGHERMEYFSCTESNSGPIMDIIWGGLNLALYLAFASDPTPDVSRGGAIAVGLAWGVFSGSAAGVGFNKSKKCRVAKQQWAQRRAQGGVVPQPQTDAPAGETVQAVVVSPQTDTVSVGERLQLTATAHSSSGATSPNRIFAWTSSNDAIASVSAAGLVTAHAAGSVVVAARIGNVVGTASVIVVARQ